MRRTVLDASCAVASILGEMTLLAAAEMQIRRVVNRPAIVPALFWYEVRHVLLRAHRRGRLTATGLGEARAQLAALDLEADADHDEDRTFALAVAHGLSVYDASYLETALRRGAALATLDRRLAAAANAENVLTSAVQG